MRQRRQRSSSANGGRGSCDDGTTFQSEQCTATIAEVNAACGYRIPG